MSLGIAGASWVTPLGNDVDEVWQQLLRGECAPIETIAGEQTNSSYLVRRVRPEGLVELPLHPRLRRASAISRFAAAAGLAALKGAKRAIDLERTALVFAISNGGVIYTRRFYGEIVRSGAQGASPLLFPETVFNAPASHLAAILGIAGLSYTIVGDGAVGILALKFAEDILASDAAAACLVVAAEEIDPLVCEAYRRWRLLRAPMRPESARGMILSEGAGALLLTSAPAEIVVEKIEPGSQFFQRSEAAGKLRRTVERLGGPAEIRIGSANGTFIDRAEEAAWGPGAYSPKSALGDSIGASVLWQAIAGGQALRTAKLPGAPETSSNSRALVLSCGLNQQLGGLLLSKTAPAP